MSEWVGEWVGEGGREGGSECVTDIYYVCVIPLI